MTINLVVLNFQKYFKNKDQYILQFVKTKIREHHLENKLNVIYKDYREHQGEYSRIYSIEMFEAVGIQYWQTYFEKIKDLLKPSGVFSMQTIVVIHIVVASIHQRSFIMQH